MDKSLLATCFLYSDVMKGDPSPRCMAKKILRRGRRRSREKGNEGVGDFRFINILTIFIFILIQLEYLP